MDHLDDQQLLAAIGANDDEALGVLFLRYHDHLLQYGLKITQDSMLVEDAIQELFIQLLLKRDRFSEVKNFRAYLFTVFRRDIRRRLQQLADQRKRQDQRFFPFDIRFTENELSAYSETDDFGQILIETLNNLPWRQREALFLRYYNGLKTKEIAEVMGIANQTVLNTLYKGLKKLKSATSIKRVITVCFALISLSLASM